MACTTASGLLPKTQRFVPNAHVHQPSLVGAPMISGLGQGTMIQADTAAVRLRPRRGVEDAKTNIDGRPRAVYRSNPRRRAMEVPKGDPVSMI